MSSDVKLSKLSGTTLEYPREKMLDSIIEPFAGNRNLYRKDQSFPEAGHEVTMAKQSGSTSGKSTTDCIVALCSVMERRPEFR